jgi:hypothetical protein
MIQRVQVLTATLNVKVRRADGTLIDLGDADHLTLGKAKDGDHNHQLGTSDPIRPIDWSDADAGRA